MTKYKTLGYVIAIIATMMLVVAILFVGNCLVYKFGILARVLFEGFSFFLLFMVFFNIQSSSATVLVKRVQNYLSVPCHSPLFNLIMECSAMGIDPEEIITIMHQHGYNNEDLILLIVELEKEK